MLCCTAVFLIEPFCKIVSYKINGTKNHCRIKENLSYLKSSGHFAVSLNPFFVVLIQKKTIFT